MNDRLQALPEDPTDAQLADACLWYRHDFGLLDGEERKRVMLEMRGYWRAIWKSVNTPGRGGQYAPLRN